MLDDTSFGELATNMQSWKCGEAEMGHRSFEEESATSTADREKLGGDGESLKDETCPIGSSRRLGHIAQFSSSSDSHAYVDRAVHPGRPALAFPDASRTLSSSRHSRVAQAIFQTLQAEQRRPPHESWRAAILLPRCSSPQVHRSSSV